MICPTCKNKNPLFARYCGMCGIPLKKRDLVAKTSVNNQTDRVKTVVSPNTSAPQKATKTESSSYSVVDLKDQDVGRDESLENKAVPMDSEIEQYIVNYVVFIDTCTMLHDHIDRFWNKAIPLLKKHNKKIILALAAYRELEKKAADEYDSELSRKAKNSVKAVSALVKEGVLEIRGEGNEHFADNVYLFVFTKFRLQYNLLLITQDYKLSGDILNLNNNQSVKAHKIEVKKINQWGNLVNPDGTYTTNRSSSVSVNSNINSVAPSIVERKKREDTFETCTRLTNIPATPIKVTSIPKAGDDVFCGNIRIKLLRQLGSGGEANVYTTNTKLNYVAKIYNANCITERKKAKIRLMLTKKIECPGICYPVRMLYNSEQQFVGYLMPSARGFELQTSVFAPRPVFERKFPGWKKKDTVQLCITILEKIKYLHDRNIILGDINPANILVVSPTEVYFVDTDSYQIEGFPCPVGMITFTAPEIQKKHFPDFLRTKGNEYFAIATLLFMIMLPGKPPYSQQGGEDQISNIMKMNFSYPLGEKTNNKTPDGPWRFIWSHLTYNIKEAFYCTFTKGEKYSLPENRLDETEWINLFSRFFDLLDSGVYANQDSMSLVLFPTRLKKNPSIDYERCSLCGTEYDKNKLTNGMCNKCLYRRGTVYRCKICNCEMLYSNFDRMRNKPRYSTCYDCHVKSKEVYETRYCKDCGCSFDISQRDADFFFRQFGKLPVRCPDCRKAKKERENQSAYSSTSVNNSDLSDVISNLFRNLF